MNTKIKYPKWKMLTAWRERRGLSAPQLAERVGTKHQYIYRLERGQQKATGEWGEKLAVALDVMVDELLPVQSMTVVEILYTAEAGNFLDAALRPPTERLPVQIPNDIRYPVQDRFIVYSSGIGHEQRFPEGTLIVCVKFNAVGGRLSNGSWYAIENTVGALKEVSVRQFVKNGRGNFFLPTNDDKFEKKVHNGPSVKALGMVTQRIMNE